MQGDCFPTPLFVALALVPEPDEAGRELHRCDSNYLTKRNEPIAINLKELELQLLRSSKGKQLKAMKKYVTTNVIFHVQQAYRRYFLLLRKKSKTQVLDS